MYALGLELGIILFNTKLGSSGDLILAPAFIITVEVSQKLRTRNRDCIISSTQPVGIDF